MAGVEPVEQRLVTLLLYSLFPKAVNEKNLMKKRVVLKDCCKQDLEAIKAKLELSRILKGVLLGTPFVFLLNNPIDAAYSIGTLDWESLTKALASVDAIVKDRCKTICDLHWISRHGNDQNLQYFWKNMSKSFDS